ncbi:MAG: SDR family oxidoreductase [Egibacteraceae bacterium]
MWTPSESTAARVAPREDAVSVVAVRTGKPYHRQQEVRSKRNPLPPPGPQGGRREGLTRVAALDYAEAGVRVNAIAPGPILTDNLKRAGASDRSGDADAPRRSARGGGGRGRLAVLGRRRLRHRTTLVIDGGKLAGARPSSAKGSQLTSDVTTFLERWAAAERSSDTAALDTALTEDLVGVRPLGFLLSQQAWLAVTRPAT